MKRGGNKIEKRKNKDNINTFDLKKISKAIRRL